MHKDMKAGMEGFGEHKARPKREVEDEDDLNPDGG